MTYSVIQDLISAKISGEWGIDPVSDNFVKVLRTTNFSNEGRLNLSSVVEREIDEVKVQKKKLQYGDIIIEKSGGSPNQPVGRVVFFDIDDGNTYLCNNFTSILRPCDKVFPRYLFYCLFALHLRKKTLAYQNKTTGIINLQLDRYLTTEKVPIPSLEDQKSIVRELDAADALRQKRKQAIALLDDYLKAVFLEMFGDPVTNPKEWDRLYGDDYSELLTVGVVIRPASHYVSNGVIALRSLNIKKNAIDLRNIVHFSKESHNGILSKSTLHVNDVVIVRTGSTGTAAVVPKELDGVNCIDLIIVRPIQKILNPFYFSFLLNSERGVSLVASKEVGGIQKHFNIGALKKLPIPIPPIELQNKFADIVRKVEKIRGTMNLQSGYMENSFNALMQEVFS